MKHIATIFGVLLFAIPGIAQQWVSATGGNWSTATNWSGGIVPTGSTTTSLSFTPIGVSAYSATNDLGSFTLRALSLSNITGSVLAIVNNPGSSLTFDGPSPNLFIGGPGPTSLSGGTVFITDTIAIRDAGFSAGPGTFTLTSDLAGAGGITIIRSSAGFLGETILNPTSNTLGVQTILTAGPLRLGSATALGTTRLAVLATGSGLSATADLRASVPMTMANGITLGTGATLNVLTGAAITLTGNIVGNGSFVLGDGLTPGTPSFNIASVTSHTGSTRVYGALTVSGSIIASPLVVGRNGTAIVGSATSFSANRLNSTADLQGGFLTMVGNATTGNNQTQSITTLNLQGFGTLSVDAQAATSTRLAVTDLVRLNRGTLRIRGDALGSLPFGTAGSATLTIGNASLIGGGGAAGTTTRSIVPYAVGSNTLTGFGDQFVTIDGNGLRTLNPTTEYSANFPLTSYAAPATTNYRLTQSAVATELHTVNAIAFATASGGIYGVAGNSSPLTVTSGAVLGAVDAHTGPLAFGSAEALVTASNGSLVLGPLTGTNGLTISGTGEAVLTNTGGLTGPFTVNGGSLVLGTTAALFASQPVTLNGGNFSVRGFNDAVSNPIAIGDSGGTVTSRPVGGSSVGNSSQLTLSGPISGSGIFTVDDAGRVVLTGDNAAFSGTWLVKGGILSAPEQSRLGTAPVVLGGGTLAIGTTISNRLVVTESSTLMPSFNSVLTGPIDGRSPTAGLTWLQSPVAVENDVYYTGPTQIGLAGSSPARGADITVRGAGGTFRGTSSVTIHEGGALRVDNSVNLLAHRLSRFPVTLAGGRLELRGSAASSFRGIEELGSLTLAAHTGNEVMLRPFDDASPASRFDFYGSLTRESGSTLLIRVSRGDEPGLGILGPGQVGEGVVRITTPPMLVNGILPNVFVSMTAEEPVSTIVTPNIRLTTTVPITSPPAGVYVRELQRFDPGVIRNTFAGSSATSNVMILSEIGLPTGTRTINSLSLQFGAAIIAATDTLTLTSGQIAMHNTNARIGTQSGFNQPPGTIASPAGVDLTIGTALELTDGGAPRRNLIAAVLNPGSGTVNFVGSGHVDFRGFSPAVARMNIHGGDIVIDPLDGEGTLSPMVHVHVNRFASLLVEGQDLSVNTISGSGGIGTIVSGTLTIGAANGSSTFSGGIGSSNGAAVIKAGTGTLRLTQLTSFSGADVFNVTGGTLAFGVATSTAPASPAVIGGRITMNDGTNLVLDGVTSFERPVTVRGGVTLDSGLTGTSTTFTDPITLLGDFFGSSILTVTAPALGGFRFSGGFTGAGELVIDSGITSFAAVSSHTGGTTIQSSSQTLIATSAPFGGQPLTLAGNTFLLPVGGNRTINSLTTLTGNVTFGPASNTDAFSNGLGLTFSAGVNLAGTGNRTVTVTSTGNFVFTGVTGEATNGLTKAGGGTLTLAGTNNFAGPLTINAGTLHVTGSKTGSGAVTVGTTTATAVPGVLSGTGLVAGAVTVRASGIVTPGASAGVLAVTNGITFESGSTYLWELAANTTSGPGTNFDQIDPGSSATVVSSGARLVPRFIGTASIPNASDVFWQSSRQWVIFDVTSHATGSSFTVDNSTWAAAGTFETTNGASGGIFLNWNPQPVPEPTTLLVMLIVPIFLKSCVTKRSQTTGQ